MGSLYFQEPPTLGKVMLSTTVGDIDIELWSKEAPKACRNFIQLCTENYYDGTLFHRLIKGFMVQGGDPNGDGTGGESVYGTPFKDEFHSRLRFVRRGLVAMANGGKDDNGSQFFFTLAASPELQNKNTIFGKVSGDTLYNMLKLEECLVCENDRPLYPHKIISSKVLLNPFPDILSRAKNEPVEIKAVLTKPKEHKNYKLLSFGEEAEEEETEIEAAAVTFKGKSKSSHDLGNDPKLSSVSAASLYGKEEKDTECLERVKKKLKVEKMTPQPNIVSKPELQDGHPDVKMKEVPISGERIESTSVRQEIQEQIRILTKTLKKKKQVPETKDDHDKTISENEESVKMSLNPLLDEFHKQQKIYKDKMEVIPVDRAERQKKTMELLAKFQAKVQKANEATDDKSNDQSSDEDEDGDSWLTHSLQCGSDVILAKDANIHPDDWYNITDPRHPINERRRLEKQTK